VTRIVGVDTRLRIEGAIGDELTKLAADQYGIEREPRGIVGEIQVIDIDGPSPFAALLDNIRQRVIAANQMPVVFLSVHGQRREIEVLAEQRALHLGTLLARDKESGAEIALTLFRPEPPPRIGRLGPALLDSFLDGERKMRRRWAMPVELARERATSKALKTLERRARRRSRRIVVAVGRDVARHRPPRGYLAREMRRLDRRLA